MKLYCITIEGVMEGSAWETMLSPSDESEPAEIDFSQDFLVGSHSPWAKDWDCIREALLEVTANGDMIGGMGLIQFATITFKYAGEGRTATRSFELKASKSIADFFTANDDARGFTVC